LGSMVTNSKVTVTQNLSKTEMSQVTGGGPACDALEFWGNAASFCLWTLNLPGYFYSTWMAEQYVDACLLEPIDTGGGNPPCCPHGGGMEPDWACSNNGGAVTGIPGCAEAQPNYVCCSYD
jgi:hypothetical protein